MFPFYQTRVSLGLWYSMSFLVCETYTQEPERADGNQTSFSGTSQELYMDHAAELNSGFAPHRLNGDMPRHDVSNQAFGV